MVPADRVTFLPGPQGDQARLKVQVMAQNDRNRKIAFTQRIFEVPRPAAAEGEPLLSFRIPVDLPRGIHVVAIGIRDQASQETSFISTGLDIQPPTDP
jgi:hypothetical protein